MSDRTCPVCGTESQKAWACHECGKPFDGDNDSTGNQDLRPDGGRIKSTHEVIVDCLADLGDHDVDGGIDDRDLVDEVDDRIDVTRADIHDALEWLIRAGEVYRPTPSSCRRTIPEGDRE